MRYVYHYYATIGRGANGGRVDGLLQTEYAVHTTERYNQFKNDLAAIHIVPPESVVVRSFSLLSGPPK